jgi:hypothetical protein
MFRRTALAPAWDAHRIRMALASHVHGTRTSMQRTRVPRCLGEAPCALPAYACTLSSATSPCATHVGCTVGCCHSLQRPAWHAGCNEHSILLLGAAVHIERLQQASFKYMLSARVCVQLTALLVQRTGCCKQLLRQTHPPTAGPCLPPCVFTPHGHALKYMTGLLPGHILATFDTLWLCPQVHKWPSAGTQLVGILTPR